MSHFLCAICHLAVPAGTAVLTATSRYLHPACATMVETLHPPTEMPPALAQLVGELKAEAVPVGVLRHIVCDNGDCAPWCQLCDVEHAARKAASEAPREPEAGVPYDGAGGETRHVNGERALPANVEDAIRRHWLAAVAFGLAPIGSGEEDTASVGSRGAASVLRAAIRTELDACEQRVREQLHLEGMREGVERLRTRAPSSGDVCGVRAAKWHASSPGDRVRAALMVPGQWGPTRIACPPEGCGAAAGEPCREAEPKAQRCNSHGLEGCWACAARPASKEAVALAEMRRRYLEHREDLARALTDRDRWRASAEEALAELRAGRDTL